MCLIRSTTRLLQEDMWELAREEGLINWARSLGFGVGSSSMLPVAPFIVVPGDQLHKFVVQSNSCFGIEDARPATHGNRCLLALDKTLNQSNLCRIQPTRWKHHWIHTLHHPQSLWIRHHLLCNPRCHAWVPQMQPCISRLLHMNKLANYHSLIIKIGKECYQKRTVCSESHS
jgi:hypothetical protein